MSANVATTRKFWFIQCGSRVAPPPLEERVIKTPECKGGDNKEKTQTKKAWGMRQRSEAEQEIFLTNTTVSYPEVCWMAVKVLSAQLLVNITGLVGIRTAKLLSSIPSLNFRNQITPQLAP